MRRHLKTIILIFLFLLTSQAHALENGLPPKNIILFIGDGMGVGPISAAKFVKGDLNLDRFSTIGVLTNNPLGTFLPRSESSTTALATGFMTNRYYVSVSPSGQRLKTVLEYAKEKGKSAGLVCTSPLTDVTPACFVAHVKARKEQSTIAEYMVNSGVDVLFGGGLAYFLPSSTKGSKRRDNKDLVAELEKRHSVITSQDEFLRLGTPSGAYGLFDLDYLPSVKNRKVTLPEMTQKAIDILSTNKSGFFLMVEGSYIDWAAHHGDSEGVIAETIDFDNAVGAALDFAIRDGNTLVIVTADHDTGGFAVLEGSVKQKTVTKTICMTTNHTGNMVLLFAYGPGSSVFGGIHNMTYVGENIIKYVVEN